jgi:hypothetical protein
MMEGPKRATARPSIFLSVGQDAATKLVFPHFDAV